MWPRRSPDIDLLDELGPQRLLLHFDPTAGHGIEALRAYAELAAAYPGRRRSNASCPASAISTSGTRRGGRAGPRCRAEAGGDRCVAVGRPAVDAAGQQMAGLPAAGRCLCGGSPGLPGAAPRRRHVQLLHRAQPQARAGRATRFHHPLHLSDRACGRRPQRHAVAGGAALHHAVGARDLMATSPTASAPRPSPCGRTPMAARPRTIPTRRRIAMANRDPRHNGLFAAAWSGRLCRARRAGRPRAADSVRLCRAVRADRRGGTNRLRRDSPAAVPCDRRAGGDGRSDITCRRSPAPRIASPRWQHAQPDGRLVLLARQPDGRRR